MARLRQSLVRDAAADPPFILFLVAVAASLIRAADQPGLDLELGSTSVTVVATDVVLAALAVTLAVRIVRTRRYPREAAALTAAAAVLGGLIVVTAALNGAGAFVAAAKLVELATLLVGAVVLVDRAGRVSAVVAVLVAITAVAAAAALVELGAVSRAARPGRVHGRARPGRALDDGARARARVPLPPRPAAAGGRARRHRRRHARNRPRRVARERLSASTWPRSRWWRSRSSAATCAAGRSSSPR